MKSVLLTAYKILQDQECLLCMEDLVKLALDVASGCHHLEEKHFVHRYLFIDMKVNGFL